MSTHFNYRYRCATRTCSFVADSRVAMYRHFNQTHASPNSSNGRASAGTAEAGVPSTTGQQLNGQPRQLYKCQFPGCGKDFTEKCNLKTHQRFHLRIKPYRCRWSGCRYQSEDRANTVRHIRVR